jgi:hypothetical protein
MNDDGSSDDDIISHLFGISQITNIFFSSVLILSIFL